MLVWTARELLFRSDLEAQKLKEPLQFVLGVEVSLELPAVSPTYLHLRAGVPCQRCLQLPVALVARAAACGDRRAPERFSLTNGKVALDDLLERPQLVAFRLRKDRAGMTRTDLSVPECLQCGLGELKETQDVGHRAAALAHALRDRLLCQAQVHQLLEGIRLLNRIEVFPLKVLDDRDLKYLPVIELPHDNGYLGQAGFLRRTVAALSGHDLKLLPGGTNQYRLQHSFLPDGSSKVRYGAGIKGLARLVLGRLELGEGQQIRVLLDLRQESI